MLVLQPATGLVSAAAVPGQTFLTLMLPLSTFCQHCWLGRDIASMHLTSPWVGHGLQGGSVPDGVMSVRAGSNIPTTWAPSRLNELITLVISRRVNRLGPGSQPEGLLGPKRVSDTLHCNLFAFPYV